MTVKDAPNVVKSKKDRQKEWLEEEILYEFFNLEEPGVPVKFTFGPSTSPKTYTLLHGGKYTHPRKIIQHLESRQVPIWGYKPNGEGRMEKNLKGYKSRFQCRQLFE